MRTLVAIFCLMGSSLFGAIDSKVDRKPVHEAFIPKIGAAIPIEMVANDPPADKIEKPPTKPNALVKWIPGYWSWDKEKNAYLWVCGVWRVPPPGTEWVPGYWKRGLGWYWISGLWHPEPSQALISPEPPPLQAEEIIGESPDQNYFWAAGSWYYNQFEKNFRWLGGSWHPFDEKWVYFPASWSWRPEGYLYHPAYWDYTLEERGIAYDCDDKQNYQPLSTTTLISRIYYTNPNYTYFFWHHFHFNSDFWKGCWCLPSWWDWQTWWTLNWQHRWSLWWWWGHPGYPQPEWLTSNMASKIASPDETLITLFKGGKLPYFFTNRGIPNELQWLQAIHKVTGNYLPLLSEKQWNQTSKEAENSLDQTKEILNPSASIISDIEPKPVIGKLVAPFSVGMVPPKPQGMPVPQIKTAPTPKIIEAPKEPVIREVPKEEISPFITRPEVVPDTPAIRGRIERRSDNDPQGIQLPRSSVVPQPIGPQPSKTWIEK